MRIHLRILALCTAVLAVSLIITSDRPSADNWVFVRKVYAIRDIEERYFGLAIKMYMSQGESWPRWWLGFHDMDRAVSDWVNENTFYVLAFSPLLFPLFLRTERRRIRSDGRISPDKKSRIAFKRAALYSLLIPALFILFNIQTLFYKTIPK